MIDIFNEIDQKSKDIAQMFCKKKKITYKMICTIVSFYKLEEKIKDMFKNKNFEMAYHEPITSKLEFYLARIFYHISLIKN
jgi:hypothetical protein